MPAPERGRVEHDAVEDVLVGFGEHVLDPAEEPPVARVNGHARGDRQVRAGCAQVLHRLVMYPAVTLASPEGDRAVRFRGDRMGSRAVQGHDANGDEGWLRT